MPQSNLKLFKFALFFIGALLILMMVWIANLAFRVQNITLAVGPDGGTYSAIAEKYAEVLEKRGYHVDLVRFDNTDEIAERVNDPQSNIDAGFSALNLDGKKLSNLDSLGDIQIQPIFIFSRSMTTHRSIRTFSDLRGMSIVLPPEHSVTSRAMLEIFREFHVDQNNARITFLPLKDAVAQLNGGKFDVGLFILSADNPYIIDLVRNPDLTLNTVADIDSMVKKFPFLRRATLPAGIYDMDKNVPASDVSLIAANISIVAKKKMATGSVYALLEAMSETHRRSTYVSRPGEFPSYTGSDLPVHPLVPDFYRVGTPWIFVNLPPSLANAVNKYLVAFLALWFLVGLRQRIEEAMGLRKYMMDIGFRLALRRIVRMATKGDALGAADLWLLEKATELVEIEGKDNSLRSMLITIDRLRGVKSRISGEG
jgi:TRAP-type uncharacterized transport system substrate-binding protein